MVKIAIFGLKHRITRKLLNIQIGNAARGLASIGGLAVTFVTLVTLILSD